MFPWLLVTMVRNMFKYHWIFIQCDNKNISGEVDDDINITYEDNTEVYNTCAASLNDEMWVFGGLNQRRQVYFKSPDKKAGIDYFL